MILISDGLFFIASRHHLAYYQSHSSKSQNTNVYKEDTTRIYTLAANAGEIYLLDFSGMSIDPTLPIFTGSKYTKDLPVQATFQLTPVSSKFLVAAWKGF